jgi:hypothetical protein
VIVADDDDGSDERWNGGGTDPDGCDGLAGGIAVEVDALAVSSITWRYAVQSSIEVADGIFAVLVLWNSLVMSQSCCELVALCDNCVV